MSRDRHAGWYWNGRDVTLLVVGALAAVSLAAAVGAGWWAATVFGWWCVPLFAVGAGVVTLVALAEVLIRRW